MAFRPKTEIDDAPHRSRGVATHIMAEQVVSQKEVAGPSQDLFGRRHWVGRVLDIEQRVGPVLAETGRSNMVRAGPDPEIAPRSAIGEFSKRRSSEPGDLFIDDIGCFDLTAQLMIDASATATFYMNAREPITVAGTQHRPAGDPARTGGRRPHWVLAQSPRRHHRRNVRLQARPRLRRDECDGTWGYPGHYGDRYFSGGPCGCLKRGSSGYREKNPELSCAGSSVLSGRLRLAPHGPPGVRGELPAPGDYDHGRG
jgi:hypothetical protein